MFWDVYLAILAAGATFMAAYFILFMMTDGFRR